MTVTGRRRIRGFRRVAARAVVVLLVLASSLAGPPSAKGGRPADPGRPWDQHRGSVRPGGEPHAGGADSATGAPGLAPGSAALAPDAAVRVARGARPLGSAERRWLAFAGEHRSAVRMQAWEDLQPVLDAARSVPVIPTVRGIYIPPGLVGWPQRFEELIALVEATELNAVVIDIKRDDGYLPYPSEIPDVVAFEGFKPVVRDMRALVEDLNRRGIYTIARIVVFKDPVAAARRPEWAVQFADGRPWRDRKGTTWLNPYNPAARAYVLAVAREAVRLGFREIQFDYVRFPSDGPVQLAVYPNRDEREPARVIGDFLREARAALPRSVVVSADIFGQIPSVRGDMGIGQRWEEVAVGIDVVSPMVYPSHYYRGVYGLPDPNAAPYQTVLNSLHDALERVPPGEGAVVRPWLQDFSLGRHYGPAEVRAQIQAVYDAGLTQWLLWNPAGRYTKEALHPAP